MSEKAEMILERRMEKRRRRRKAKGMVFLALLFFIGLLIFALYSPLFNIREINVQGMDKLKKDDIINASEIEKGQNVFKFSNMKAEHGIETEPYIKEARVSRKLPDVVQISVKERIPIAALAYLSSYILIDEQGIALEADPDINGKRLIEIKGLQFNKFTLGKPIIESNDEDLKAVLSVLTLLQKDDLLLKIDYFDVNNQEYPNKIIMHLDKKYTVILGDKLSFGSVGEFKYRLDFLKSILQSGKINQNGYIDLTLERPTFRPETKGVQQ